MSKHTPTPWAPNKYGELKGANGDNVQVWGLGIAHASRSDTSEANTAFIIRAVNAHAQLLEALKHWHKYGSTDWADDVAMMLFYADCEANTSAAIRAAEGEE